ncbi:MAG: hypothetical protein LUO85_05865 [Methanomassiliicoccales archaeon]|nr:hypothetical protein [Methanomassiliicoccales archaeon]
MADVCIRGVDDDVYARFAAEAKKRGLAIGELTTAVMREVVDRGAAPSYRIKDLDMLNVSKTDLESVDGPVIFSDIDMLNFEDDVTWPVFNEHVEMIKDVAMITLPKTLSKFQVLTKSKDVAAITNRK